MVDDAPVVDDDHGRYPAVAVVEEEGHVIFVLTVEIFLIVHLLVVESLDQKGVIAHRYLKHGLARGALGDGQGGVVRHEEAVDGELGQRCAEYGARESGHLEIGGFAAGRGLGVGVDVNGASHGAPGAVIDDGVGVAQRVVVVEPSVVVGDREVEEVVIDH